jgi:hypothetical protein
MPDEQPYLMLLYRRAFAARDASLVQVSFDARVVDRYRGAPGYVLDRTETVGRIKREGGWTLDLGIDEEGGTVHASLGDVFSVLPEEEREHWAQHVVALPMSQRFLQTRFGGAACIDDGEVRAWD